MRSKPTAFIAVLIMSFFAVVMIGCNKTNLETPDDPPVVEKTFTNLSYAEFSAKSEEFLTLSNYMSLLGADFSYSDSRTETSIKASLDMSMTEDVMVGIEYGRLDDAIRVHLGGGRLFVYVKNSGNEKKDSMKFDNDLTDIMNELRNGEGFINSVEYLIQSLKDELGLKGEFFDREAAMSELEKCTFLYYEGERVDEYMILANHSYNDKFYQSSAPYDIFVEFKVSGGCVISLNGTVERDSGKAEFLFERRSNSSKQIELPDEVYSGDMLDYFEELYENRNKTIKDFEGVWTCEGYTLEIGSKINLTTSDGEISLDVYSLMANYLTLVSDDEVYVAHLTDVLELNLPNGEVLLMQKVD